MDKISIKDNNVSAENQVPPALATFFVGNKEAKKRILILGNSITRHAPAPDIGWENDCGMAASSLENDYVHKLYSKLNGEYYFMVKQASYWERHYQEENILENKFSDAKAFNADIVIFRIGENISGLNWESSNILRGYFEKFIDYLSNGKNKIILTTSVWKNTLVDTPVTDIAKEKNLTILDLNCVSYDESNLAIGKFWHKGVSIHPGDKGMELIANILANEINKQ